MSAMRIGSLCSGYGGLDMGVQLVLPATVAWHCEFAAGPSRILAHRYPGVPNHHDLTATDWATVEPVDIITAGWPCQPWSLAGRRRGINDERAIWPAIAGAIRVLRPRYVFLENVPAVVAVGELGRAAGDLAELGYVGSWRCLRASDVGAPHGRNRIFIAATDASHNGSEIVRGCITRRPQACETGAGNACGDGGRSPNPNTSGVGRGTSGGDNGFRPEGLEPITATNTPGDGWHEGWPEPAGQLRRSDAAECGDAATTDADLATGTRLADTSQRFAFGGAAAGGPGAGDRPTEWGQYSPAIARWAFVLGRCAPSPTEPGARGGQRLSPRFVEWLMGLPDGWVIDVPGLSRNEQLKALGNGVVPQQAAAAYRGLLSAVGVAP